MGAGDLGSRVLIRDDFIPVAAARRQWGRGIGIITPAATGPSKAELGAAGERRSGHGGIPSVGVGGPAFL